MTSRQPAGRSKKARKASPKSGNKKPTNKKFKKRFSVLQSRAVATLGKNVRRLREGLELSQAQLAGAIGTDQAAIGLIELARANPTLLTLEALAKALDTTVADLLTRPPRSRT
jgi:ribosome-binding protein aMBF1 (putative translation factor)